MRIRAVTVAAAAVLLPGCGGTSDTDRLTAFIDDANAIQQRAAPRFTAADDAYRRFAEGKLRGRAAELELRRAELDVEAARQELAALSPPPQARRLRTLLLRSYELNVLLAAETRQMAVYLPRAQDALEDLAGVRRRLRRSLRSTVPARQVSALRAYATSLRAVRDRIDRLTAPPTMVADQETQLRVLGRARSLAQRLAAAIEREDAEEVVALLDRFRDGGDPRPDLADLGDGAIRAYGQRLRELDRAAQAVRSERARLQAAST